MATATEAGRSLKRFIRPPKLYEVFATSMTTLLLGGGIAVATTFNNHSQAAEAFPISITSRERREAYNLIGESINVFDAKAHEAILRGETNIDVSTAMPNKDEFDKAIALQKHYHTQLKAQSAEEDRLNKESFPGTTALLSMQMPTEVKLPDIAEGSIVAGFAGAISSIAIGMRRGWGYERRLRPAPQTP